MQSQWQRLRQNAEENVQQREQRDRDLPLLQHPVHQEAPVQLHTAVQAQAAHHAAAGRLPAEATVPVEALQAVVQAQAVHHAAAQAVQIQVQAVPPDQISQVTLRSL